MKGDAVVCWSQLVPASENQLLNFQEFCELVENAPPDLFAHSHSQRQNRSMELASSSLKEKVA